MGHRELKPTMPLSETDTLVQKAALIGRSPLTISVSVASAIALCSMAVAPWWIGAGTAATLLCGLCLYWKKRIPMLREKVRSALIHQSNQSQNRSLEKGEEQLREWKQHDLADELAQFKNLKKEVEAGAHVFGTEMSMSESLEKLVDTLCNEVSKDLFKIADLRYTARKRSRRLSESTKSDMKADEAELLERISVAKEALGASAKQLSVNSAPTNKTPGDNATLDRTIEKLKAETELARRIRERVNGKYESVLWPADAEFSSVTTVGSASVAENLK